MPPTLPPEAQRCWNCWQLGHKSSICPKPSLKPHERELLRIKLQVPAPAGLVIFLAERPCFNCWKDSKHSLYNCNERQRSDREREELRVKLGIPMTETWWKFMKEGAQIRQRQETVAAKSTPAERKVEHKATKDKVEGGLQHAREKNDLKRGEITPPHLKWKKEKLNSKQRDDTSDTASTMVDNLTPTSNKFTQSIITADLLLFHETLPAITERPTSKQIKVCSEHIIHNEVFSLLDHDPESSGVLPMPLTPTPPMQTPISVNRDEHPLSPRPTSLDLESSLSTNESSHDSYTSPQAHAKITLPDGSQVGYSETWKVLVKLNEVMQGQRRLVREVNNIAYRIEMMDIRLARLEDH